jgi:hypothetical protein
MMALVDLFTGAYTGVPVPGRILLVLGAPASVTAVGLWELRRLRVHHGLPVQGCQTVYSSEAFGPDGDLTGDDWLAVEHPEGVAAVLLITNDQSYDGRTCEQDVKDGGGPHPPEPARIGDHL